MQEVDKKKDNISVSSFSCRAKVKVYIYPAFTKWNSAEKGICFLLRFSMLSKIPVPS